MFSAEREDQMRVWMNSIKQIKTKLQELDDSDVEAYTSSDEENQKPSGFFDGCCFSLKKLLKIKKHRYHHIVENADFLQQVPDLKETETQLKEDHEKFQVTFKVPVDQKEKLLEITKRLNEELGITFEINSSPSKRVTFELIEEKN